MKRQEEVLLEIKAEFADLPNVGYVLVSHEVMERPAFADFMVDNFTFLEDRTTELDRANKRSRLVLYSERFTRGWGQYEIWTHCYSNDSYTLERVDFLAKS